MLRKILIEVRQVLFWTEKDGLLLELSVSRKELFDAERNAETDNLTHLILSKKLDRIKRAFPEYALLITEIEKQKIAAEEAFDKSSGQAEMLKARIKRIQAHVFEIDSRRNCSFITNKATY